MAAPKGHPRYGGRKAGTPNKSTSELMQKCIDKGVDVFEEMLSIAMTSIDPFQRFNYFKEIASYIYPKRKALEVDANVNMDLAQKAEEYAAMSKEEQIAIMEKELKKLKESS